MKARQSSADILARLRTIRGHLKATHRLVRAGRSLDAITQLTAIRAALRSVAVEILRHHVRRCLAEKPTPIAAEELLICVRYAMAARRLGCPETRALARFSGRPAGDLDG